jgi:chemotaxis protein methyltransferase CheR
MAKKSKEPKEAMEPQHDEKGFEALKIKIFKDRGLDTFDYKKKFLKRRFRARMRSRRIVTYKEYMALLDSDPKEYPLLFDKLTINVTEFFRNPEMWEAFRKKILPKVLADPEERRIVRLWSAGCSSGEEVYTIAMLIDQYLWNKDSNLQVVIRGTDLDDEAIKKAREASYLPEKVRKVPEVLKKLYLTYDGERYHVKESIMKMVRLVKHDLIIGKKQKYFDVIFCRNVVIYFSRELQKSVFTDFHNALTVDGYMIIGKTETLVGDIKKLFKVVDSHERIYQKA